MITAGFLFASLAAAEVDPFVRAIPVPGAEFDFERGGDLDFDGQPDDWTRRTGTGFPNYVTFEIDPAVGYGGGRSLRVNANGGKAAMYSAPAAISPHHSYLFAGRVRTQGLRQDAAIISVSFLNARRERVRRVLGPPVSGSFDGWTEVRIGPVMPTRDVRFVSVGVHLVHGEGMDYSGSAWFDEFSLRMLPRLSLRTNFEAQFRAAEVPIDVEAVVSGLDASGDYALRLVLEDAESRPRDRREFPLDRGPDASAPHTGDDATPHPQAADAGPPDVDGDLPDHAALPHVPTDESITERAAAPMTRRWTLPPQQPGFYRLHARLIRDGAVVLEESTSLAVLDRTDRRDPEGQPSFGWSVEVWPAGVDADRLAAVAAEAGIGWIKLPLWDTVTPGDLEGGRSGEVVQLLTTLRRQGIEPVGVLKEPPREVRRKFADDWNGVSELFAMPPDFWLPSVEPVMARYGSLVQHWQLGGESDASFAGLPGLGAMMENLKRQFDRMGRDTTLGAHWQWGRPVPENLTGERPFLSLASTPAATEADLIRLLKKSKAAGFARWPLLRPRPATLSGVRTVRRRDLDRRAADLLRRIVATRIGGADVVFAADVFHPRLGVLNADASPGELFLPWRTWALALDAATPLGSMTLPESSRNHVFVRGEEAIVCLWNDEAARETISLGPDLRVVNLWGQSTRPPSVAGRHEVDVDRVPVLLRGGSARLARFQLAARFEKGRMPSSTDEFEDELILTNPFPQAISVECELRAPREWEVRPRLVQMTMAAEETARVPVLFRVPSHQSLGPEPLQLRFRVDADNFYEFTVHRDYTVGLGDVTIEVETFDLPGGQVEVRQRIVNNTPEELSFAVSLYAPGQKRQRRRVVGLTEGQSNVLSYRVPEADALRGQRLRIRAEQEGGNRVLNKKFLLK